MAILGILVGIALPSYRKSVQKTNRANGEIDSGAVDLA